MLSSLKVYLLIIVPLTTFYDIYHFPLTKGQPSSGNAIKSWRNIGWNRFYIIYCSYEK